MRMAFEAAQRLKNPILPYAWGSRFAIAELCGRRVPSPQPEAELWMGAHPKAPSQVALEGEDVGLDRLIARHPEAILGKRAARRFGCRLPFLFKVLAAEEPLSIQAHPDRKLALEGFERENRVGIPLDAPHRNYRDDNHKPEIICALTEFWGLNGFRSLEDVESGLERFCPKGIDALWTACRGASPRQALRGMFEKMLGLKGAGKNAILAEALDKARNSAAEDPIAEWVQALQTAYPGDIGILAPIVLNLVRLEPGQAMYLPARQLHAYLKGVGIELMANSDNVLRGGLTPKHIDPEELLRVLRFAPSSANLVRPKVISVSETIFPAPAEEFQLAKIDLQPPNIHEAPGVRSVEILLVTSGALDLQVHGRGTMRLNRGESVLIPAAAGAYRLSGQGLCYKAGVPTSAA